MKPESKDFSAQVGNQTLTFSTGKVAQLAGGAVTARLGDTLILATATMSANPRSGIDFFPLSVDYEERMYAGGKIPGSFFRREGRPSEGAILTARLTDRPLRPLFPKDLRNDVQVIMYALSADEENVIDVIAVNAASAALSISDIPWNGPVGAVRVGRVDGQLVINPTYSQLKESDLDLRVAGTRDAILMVECGANEVDEDTMVAALEAAHQAMQPIIDMQVQMAEQVGKPKRAYQSFKVDEALKATVLERTQAELEQIFDQQIGKTDQYGAIDALRDTVVAELAGDDAELAGQVKEAYGSAEKAVVRRRIIEQGKRPDGRTPTDIRPIWCEVDYSPRAHGSGIFTRGETQVLTLATLGTPREAQELDTLTPIKEKRYMHHYNFPPFSTGEARPLRGSSRREIGHGALAERALVAVIPSEKEFPYTLRLVSECLSSNGSTSMGSVCASTLALMDTGVPIKAPVSGIAMGLITDGSKYQILSDIQGIEDHLGDMDFKVAGTDKGITALQMDIKISGLTTQMMAEALQQAKAGRKHILDKMLETLPAPRPDLKAHAPRITTVMVPIEKIGAVIGPGGKTIRAIQEESGAKIDISDDGTVFIASDNAEAAQIARERIEALTETPEIGRIYTGKVVRITDFGAFIEIMPGTDGLVHISQLDSGHVESVESVVQMGDEVSVMITDIDPSGKIRLSRQAVLEGWTAEEAREKDKGGRPSGGGGGGRGGDRRGGGGGRDRGDRGGGFRGRR
ncbi:MAG: polyribonucleotide nucleotidyltransferase [Anaerolineales bacterium]|nr:polyribonucleotide nucleotidyltransferase [Anaerolineales bacterium]MCW5855174.1 polyribonucleotide nucleotidyltransferase [Anaerolineales bacterium]